MALQRRLHRVVPFSWSSPRPNAGQWLGSAPAGCEVCRGSPADNENPTLDRDLADPYNQLPAMTFWLLGSLAATTVSDLLPLSGPVVVGTIVLIALRWRLNVMSLPEDEARALGLATGPFRIAIVAAATLVTSASVATSGVIGWVGLVVPHLARALVGPDFPRLIPTAALLGGGYLLFIDTLARTAAPVEIPLGILTAVIGTPFFIWLLAGMQRTWS